MADTIKKYRIREKIDSNNTLILHPETESSVVIHNGESLSSVLTDIDNEITNIATNRVSGVKGDSETSYRTGNVNITKANIGLGNVNNTSDADKPISTATQNALNLKEDKSNLKALAYKDSLSKSDVGLGNVTNDAQVKRSEMGQAGGVAQLDASGKVPSSQLPSYVDDVLEYASKSNFPTTGESGKIYVDKSTNITYRWGGSSYVEISPSLALGETSSTAYAGDKGKQNATNIATNTSNINKIINGTTTVKKAEQDGSGNNIVNTYAKKADVVDKTSEQTISGDKWFTGTTSIDELFLRPKGDNALPKIRVLNNQAVSEYNLLLPNYSSGDHTIATTDDIPTIPNLSVDSSVSGSFIKDLTVSGHKITQTKGNITNSDLPNSGITAGTYSAIAVNSKGIATSGAQIIEIGTTANGSPSTNLAIGGLYFQLLE